MSHATRIDRRTLLKGAAGAAAAAGTVTLY